jgi:hypothetical protein
MLVKGSLNRLCQQGEARFRSTGSTSGPVLFAADLGFTDEESGTPMGRGLGTRSRTARRVFAFTACLIVGALGDATGAAATTRTFTYTGGEQTFKVPTGVFSLEVHAIGGHGGSVEGAPGGKGADVTGLVRVNPGETIYVEVGGNAGRSGGFNGGGVASQFPGEFTVA